MSRAAQIRREVDEFLTKPKRFVLGSGAITEELARALPRYDFIAHYLAVVTKKKDGRDLAGGKRVRRMGNRWQIVSPIGGGVVEYETPDTDRLFHAYPVGCQTTAKAVRSLVWKIGILNLRLRCQQKQQRRVIWRWSISCRLSLRQSQNRSPASSWKWNRRGCDGWEVG